MLRYGIHFSAIPQGTDRGDFSIEASFTVWGDGECVQSVALGEKYVTDFPYVTSKTDVSELTAEWADLFYQFSTQLYAERTDRGESEVNARPGSASTN